MLSNAYFLAKFHFDTAENEPAENLQNFAKILQKLKICKILRSAPGEAANCAQRTLAPERHGARPRAARAARGAPRARPAHAFARFRLYRRRSLQVNTHFAALFKIYQMI